MDYDLTEDQAALVSSLENIIGEHWDLPAAHRSTPSYFATDLQVRLAANGFLEVIRTPGFGPLEGVLVVGTASRVPVAVETGASVLVAPKLLNEVSGPVAIVAGDPLKAHRFLSVAQTALVLFDGEVLALDIRPGTVEPVESILAYPYGRFRGDIDLSVARRLPVGSRDLLLQWARVALAAEAAGAMRSAVDFTVDYVKQRRLFGRALGSFQAVQHRLAQCHQTARAARYMALKAGWSGEPVDAALAALYVQDQIPKVCFDLHQFHGGMGVSYEHKLHFWTYRLKALLGDLGGADAAAASAADILWGEPPPAVRTEDFLPIADAVA